VKTKECIQGDRSPLSISEGKVPSEGTVLLTLCS